MSERDLNLTVGKLIRALAQLPENTPVKWGRYSGTQDEPLASEHHGFGTAWVDGKLCLVIEDGEATECESWTPLREGAK